MTTLLTHSHRRLACILAVGTFALAVGVSTAHADSSFCHLGSGTGQCEKPDGVAVDPVSGNVYVGDRDNYRVDVFDSAGGFLFAFGWGVVDGISNEFQTCTTTCFKGIPGSGAGQFAQSGGKALAIDSNPASLSYRDVYVFDGNNLRIEKFDREGNFLLAFGSQGSGDGQFARADDRIAVGPGGNVYTTDSERFGGGNSDFHARVEKFDPAGSFVGSSVLTDGEPTAGLAVDSAGNAYIIRGGVEKYELSEPNATKLGEAGAASNTRSLAIGPSDRLFASQTEGQLHHVITEYDPALTELRRFGYGEIDKNFLGLAVAAAGDGVYGSEPAQSLAEPTEKVLSIPFPPPGPLACCTEAAPVGNAKATLNGGVNPEGKSTTYHFDYVELATYQADIVAEGPGHGFDHAKHTPESASVGSNLTLHAASAEVGCTDPVAEAGSGNCLTPETAYRFRLLATDSVDTNTAEGEFTTPPSLRILETFSTDVGTDAARLHATVDPLGIPASGYFQYVDDAGFKASGFAGATRVPAAGQIDFGSIGAQSRVAQLSSLAPATTYHYRVLATDPLLPLPIVGPELTFTTFPLPAAPKTDCPNQAFRIGASANLPDCRAYEMVSPLEKGNADIVVLKNVRGLPAGLDQSSDIGDRLSYSSATAFGATLGGHYSSQYIASRDPEAGWSTEPISPPRGPKSLTDNANVKLDVEFKAFSADLASAWFLQDTDPPLSTCAPQGYLNIYRRDESGGYEALSTAKPANQPTGNEYFPELVGVSADGTHAVFRANGKLTANASNALSSKNAPIDQIYEHVSDKGCGDLRLVSVLPDKKASQFPSTVGTGPELEVEGRRNTVARAVSEDGSRIFWTVAADHTGQGPGALYVRIGGKETLEISAGPARYWTAATDGSKVFYTVGEELYEYDLSAKAQTLIAKGVIGVAEASEDGSRIYFLSTEALGGKGETGKPNLYLRGGGGAIKLVGTLDAPESPNGKGAFFDDEGFVVASPVANTRGTRSTLDGAHLAFLSTAPLTGYDNGDAADGRPDLELFLYDAETDHLACISCNPSGARPAGRKFENVNATLRVAARMAPSENQFFVPRNLTADGNRLFFESFEALLPRDTNGRGDVYEWQRAAGEEGCEEAGAELYVPSSGGCLSLISSGQSPADSSFDDASPDGKNVFIKTSSSLLPQDPGLVDIYDVRTEGGFAPAPAPPPACEGEACQGTLSPPSDPTPASSAFEGAGNVIEKLASCRKPKVRRKGRCVAKHSHKRHAKHKRRAKR